METAILKKNPKRTTDQFMSGAQAVVHSLLKEGVDLIFGYPGGAIMPVYDALYDYENELKHILVRHEQGATHAAQGYARASGKVGVCLATSGPGATNLITGIADAQIDSTPLVCITGQVASPLLGTDAFQETDVIGISMPVTKWNYQVTRASEIPGAIAKAFYIAKTGKPGPVLVDITKDAQFEMLNFDYKPFTGMRSYVTCPSIDLSKIQEAASMINAAKRPLVLFGQGVILSGAINDSSIAIMAAIFLFIIPSNRPKRQRLINWEVAQNIPWGALILIGGGLSLASVISSSGLATWIGSLSSNISNISIIFIGGTKYLEDNKYN